MKKSIVIIALAAVALIAPLRAQGIILEQVLVKVNGEIFTKTALEQRQIEQLQQTNKQMVTSLDLQSDAKLRAALADITPQILVDAVDELLMVQRGRELGAHLSDDQFKRVVDQIKKENNITTDEQLQAGLRQQNMTMAQFREQVEHNYMIEQVKEQEITPKFSLTDEEAREYYASHQSEFLKPSIAMIREILITVPVQMQNGQPVLNAGVDNDTEEKMKAVRDRIVKGEDFTKLVAELSEAPSKADGGLIGPIPLAELAPALHDLIDKLKPGEVSEPIRTVRGFQLFKLESKTSPQVDAFANVRDAITQKVYAQRADQETKKYVEKLRTDAIIEWKNDDYKKMYDQQLAARSAGK